MSKQIKILFCFHYSILNNGGVRSMVDIIENIIKKDGVTVYVVYPTRKETAIYLFISSIKMEEKECGNI